MTSLVFTPNIRQCNGGSIHRCCSGVLYGTSRGTPNHRRVLSSSRMHMPGEADARASTDENAKQHSITTRNHSQCKSRRRHGVAAEVRMNIDDYDDETNHPWIQMHEYDRMIFMVPNTTGTDDLHSKHSGGMLLLQIYFVHVECRRFACGERNS